MLIESIIRRKNGSDIPLFGAVYKFRPDTTGRHVCEVDNDRAVERLLDIPEGFKPANAAEVIPPKPVKPAAIEPVIESLLGSNVHPSEIQVGELTYTLGDIVRGAFANSCLQTDEWNALDEETRHEYIDNHLDALALAPPPTAPVEPVVDPVEDAAKKERAILAEAFRQKFGRAPHGKWLADKIRAELEKV